MIDRRPQGRPCRGGLEVGKEKILNAFRAMLRTAKHDDMSRKAIAAYAGVTPALISYYFPKKQQLFNEAVTPVVAAYAEKICHVSTAPYSREDKTLRIIDLLIELYKQDGRIVDLYCEVASNQDHLKKVTAALAELFDPEWDVKSPEQKATCCFETTLLQGALWGMCRFAAQAEEVVLPRDLEVPNGAWLRTQVANALTNFVHRVPALG